MKNFQPNGKEDMHGYLARADRLRRAHALLNVPLQEYSLIHQVFSGLMAFDESWSFCHKEFIGALGGTTTEMAWSWETAKAFLFSEQGERTSTYSFARGGSRPPLGVLQRKPLRPGAARAAGSGDEDEEAAAASTGPPGAYQHPHKGRFAHIKCYGCQQFGHYQNHCPTNPLPPSAGQGEGRGFGRGRGRGAPTGANAVPIGAGSEAQADAANPDEGPGSARS